MKIKHSIIGFRYRKGFIINILLAKNIKLNENKIFKNHRYCPICNTDEYEIIAEVDRVGMLTETVVCSTCDFVFNNSFIMDPNSFYSSEWGTERWGDPKDNFLRRTASDAFSWKRLAYIAKKLGKYFEKIETVLEVGCGDGCNLLPYHLIGKNVIGCDFDPRFLAPGREKGMELIEGDLSNIPVDRKFDLIMLIHSFEHMIKLDEIVQEVYGRLNRGGLVFVEVPGILNWNRTKNATKTAMGLKSSNNFLGYLQFQHNYHFDLGHLKYIWERNGFEMVEGDEWVRAIFKKKAVKESTHIETQPNWNELNKNVILHLKGVEKDFLRLQNLICGFVKLIFRKFC